jgi:hypothetical protein
MNLSCTLVAEGTTDKALLPILGWAIRRDLRVKEFELQFAEPFLLPPIRDRLTPKIRRALELYPCNLLFVHRDADREAAVTRREEIRGAVAAAAGGPVAVPVVPVRMTEAWLLINEAAIRSAAGNPRGTMALELPSRSVAIEREPNPKALLHNALRSACGLHGRKLAKFDPQASARRVSELVVDWGPLRQLAAYLEFEHELQGALDHLASKSTRGTGFRDPH